MNDLPSLLVILMIPAVIFFILYWNSSRSQDIIQNWASETATTSSTAATASSAAPSSSAPKLNLARWERARWNRRRRTRRVRVRGSESSQTVYRVTIRDQQGYIRKGWVRCGGWFTGLLSNQAEVKWD